MSNGLNNLLDAAGKLVDIVPSAYEDALQPTVQEFGQVIAKVPKAINAALIGVDCWIEEKKYKLDETKKLLEHKLQNVDPDKIVPPEQYVAIPALQAISYSMDSKELRDLYANLLAKSMNSDYKDSVHPSFVEIIKQMSPIDAIILKNILEQAITPLIDLSILLEDGGNIHYHYNLSWIDKYSQDIISISIDNLIHLGLIEVPYDRSYTNEHNYDRVRQTESYSAAYKQLEEVLGSTQGTINEDKKILKVSSLAKLFYKICISE